MSLLSHLWGLFDAHLLGAPSTPTLFNPYRDFDPALDVPGAPEIRQDNLRSYLESFATEPTVLLVAEAPGPWGARFSGVPLVSEAQLLDPGFPVTGTPTSLAGPHAEYSAKIYHRVIAPYRAQIFTWNAVPFHPHRSGAPLTIRTPTTGERRRFSPFLAELADLLRPRQTLAMGRVAERSLREIGLEPLYLRHPSQGGAKLFEAGLHAAMTGA